MSDGRQPEVDFLHHWAAVWLKLSSKSSLKEKRNVAIQICQRQSRSKGRRTHFQLTCMAQKRLCLSSLPIITFTPSFSALPLIQNIELTVNRCFFQRSNSYSRIWEVKSTGNLIIHVAWRRQEGYIWWMNWSDNFNMDLMLILPALPRSSSGPLSGFHDNDLHLVSKKLGFFFFKYIFCTIKINFVNT